LFSEKIQNHDRAVLQANGLQIDENIGVNNSVCNLKNTFFLIEIA